MKFLLLKSYRRALTLANDVPDTQLFSGDEDADLVGEGLAADVNEWLPW